MEERPLADGVHPDLTPEGRRRAALQARFDRHMGPQGRFWATRFWRVLARVGLGTWRDGFIHAGNLAYMALLTLFPFFIVVAAIASALGDPGQREASIDAFLRALPPVVARVLGPVAHDVAAARSGMLLWIGCAVGLWTTSSLLETIRDILHRAYGTPQTRAFWHYRLISTGVIFAAVILLLLSLFVQVAIVALEEAIAVWFPGMDALFQSLTFSRVVSALSIYGSVFLLFLTLTPEAYRGRPYPKWPGALLISLWWVVTTLFLPMALRTLFAYDLTYGSLAGVMIALFFFWLVGLGVVAGAELNAALAVTPEERRLLAQDDSSG